MKLSHIRHLPVVSPSTHELFGLPRREQRRQLENQLPNTPIGVLSMRDVMIAGVDLEELGDTTGRWNHTYKLSKMHPETKVFVPTPYQLDKFGPGWMH